MELVPPNFSSHLKARPSSYIFRCLLRFTVAVGDIASMQFEFTGDKPVWQTGSSAPPPSFSSFISGSNIGVSFGVATSHESDSSWSSFGNPPLETYRPPGDARGKPVPPPGLLSGNATAANMPDDRVVVAEQAALQTYAADDVLMQAFKRGLQGRPAVFGHAAVMSDAVLAGFVAVEGATEGEAKLQLAEASRDIRTLGANSAGRRLINHLLAEVTRLKAPAPPRLTMQAGPTTMVDDGDGPLPAWLTGSVSDQRSAPEVAAAANSEDIVTGGHEQAESTGTPTHDVGTSGSETTSSQGQSEGDTSKSPIQAAVQDEEASEALAPNIPPFRFLDLPPELRVSVYRELLAPGHISIRQPKHDGPRTVVATFALYPAILRTSRQIYKESRDILYNDNTVLLNVHLTLGCGRTNMINAEHMPWAKLARLRNVTFVVHAAAPNDVTISGPFRCDWRQFQAMIGLKGARICVLERQDQQGPPKYLEYKTLLLKEIIERMPADCKVSYGARNGPEQSHLKHVLGGLMDGRMGIKGYNRPCCAVDEEVLRKCAEPLLGSQGVKSGCSKDHRWPERKMLQLGSLVKDEDMDESIVLGR